MALFSFGGFEVGSSAELYSVSGTVAFVTSGQRTGGYAARVNVTGVNLGSFVLPMPAANGKYSQFASGVSAVRLGFGFAATLPAGAGEPIAYIYDTTGAIKAHLRVTSAGEIVLYNNVGTLVATTSGAGLGAAYKYVEVTVGTGSPSSYDVRVNGTSLISGTGYFGTNGFGNAALGRIVAIAWQNCDFYYDDYYLDTAAFIATASALPEVRFAVPNAAGASAGWTNGTGTTYAEVDEVPPGSDGTDSTTTISASAVEDNTYSTFLCQSSATIGLTGTIQGVSGFVRCWTASISGSSLVAVRIRNSGADADSTPMELTVAAQNLQKVQLTNPNGGGAWTTGGFDLTEIGMTAGTIAQIQYFTAAYIWALTLVTTSVSVNINAPTATTSAADALAPKLSTQVTALLAVTSDASAPAPTVSIRVHVNVAATVATTSAADALAPKLSVSIGAAISSATADALAPKLSVSIGSEVATAGADVLAPKLSTSITAAVASAAGVANAPGLSVSVVAPVSLADATVPPPGIEAETIASISAALATAAADAPAPVIQTTAGSDSVNIQATVASAFADATAPAIIGVRNPSIVSVVADATAAIPVPTIRRSVVVLAVLGASTADAIAPSVVAVRIVAVASVVSPALAAALTPKLSTSIVAATAGATAGAVVPQISVQANAMVAAAVATATALAFEPQLLQPRDADILAQAAVALAVAMVPRVYVSGRLPRPRLSEPVATPTGRRNSSPVFAPAPMLRQSQPGMYDA